MGEKENGNILNSVVCVLTNHFSNPITETPTDELVFGIELINLLSLLSL